MGGHVLLGAVWTAKHATHRPGVVLLELHRYGEYGAIKGVVVELARELQGVGSPKVRAHVIQRVLMNERVLHGGIEFLFGGRHPFDGCVARMPQHHNSHGTNFWDERTGLVLQSAGQMCRSNGFAPILKSSP